MINRHILPIESKKNEIIETVRNNAVTIIEGSTACGKTSRIPLFLAEAGYRVIVTEPRRIATISAAKSTASRLGDNSFGNEVGYHTGLSSKFSKNSLITFMTDGTELLRVLSDKEDFKNTVLIIDEVHEGSIIIEFLLAFCKNLVLLNPELKIVLMSATAETKKMSEFFFKSPIITIQHTGYIISKVFKHAKKLQSTIVSLVQCKTNTLVFLPGKPEIEELEEALNNEFKASNSKVEICPLHAEIGEVEQKKALSHPELGYTKVILATDIAQTSIDPRVSAIVDSGLTREIQLIDGIPTLVTRHCSQAECLQRSGRTGRTGDGTYYLCSDVKFENRNPFPNSEIEYGQLDNVLLTLICNNIHIEDLEFFHKPVEVNINYALKSLRLLGAIDNSNNITEIGIEMQKLALDPRYARMVIEARKYAVERDALICALIAQIGNVSNTFHFNKYSSYHSDLFSQLSVFKSINPAKLTPDINAVNYIHIKEYEKKNLSKLKDSRFSPTINIPALKRCIAVAFPDHLYIQKQSGYVNALEGVPRHLYQNSSLARKRPKFVVGVPMNFRNLCTKDSYNRIIAPTEFSLDEVIECFSDSLDVTYAFNKNDMFDILSNPSNNKVDKVLSYNGIEIKRFSIGTVKEIKLSDPKGFHKEIEINTRFKQKYLSTYYHNLKISSRLILS